MNQFIYPSSGFLFRDRQDAAFQLIKKLTRFKGENGVVFAIPRGGIPMGRLIADELDWPLEPLLIKKIGHPENPEYAIGAVTMDGENLFRKPDGVPDHYFEREVRRIRSLLLDRQKRYMGSRPLQQLEGRIALVIDDGIATGRTLEVGLRSLRKRNPKSLVVAVPVASPEAAQRICQQCDEFICLQEPEDFAGIGQFYEDFRQVDDEEVEKLLKPI